MRFCLCTGCQSICCMCYNRRYAFTLTAFLKSTTMEIKFSKIFPSQYSQVNSFLSDTQVLENNTYQTTSCRRAPNRRKVSFHSEDIHKLRGNGMTNYRRKVGLYPRFSPHPKQNRVRKCCVWLWKQCRKAR